MFFNFRQWTKQVLIRETADCCVVVFALTATCVKSKWLSFSLPWYASFGVPCKNRAKVTYCSPTPPGCSASAGCCRRRPWPRSGQWRAAQTCSALPRGSRAHEAAACGEQHGQLTLRGTTQQKHNTWHLRL